MSHIVVNNLFDHSYAKDDVEFLRKINQEQDNILYKQAKEIKQMKST